MAYDRDAPAQPSAAQIATLAAKGRRGAERARPDADGRALELKRDNLASARQQAQLHGPPAAPIQLFSRQLFSPGPRQAVPLGSGVSGEAALGRPRAPVTSTRSRPSDDEE